MLPGPDYASSMRIRIQEVSHSADPDPHHYSLLTPRLNILFIYSIRIFSGACAHHAGQFPRNNCLVVAGIYWLFLTSERGTYRARVPSGSAQWAIIGGVWCGILRQFGGVVGGEGT